MATIAPVEAIEVVVTRYSPPSRRTGGLFLAKTSPMTGCLAPTPEGAFEAAVRTMRGTGSLKGEAKMVVVAPKPPVGPVKLGRVSLAA